MDRSEPEHGLRGEARPHHAEHRKDQFRIGLPGLDAVQPLSVALHRSRGASQKSGPRLAPKEHGLGLRGIGKERGTHRAGLGQWGTHPILSGNGCSRIPRMDAPKRSAYPMPAPQPKWNAHASLPTGADPCVEAVFINSILTQNPLLNPPISIARARAYAPESPFLKRDFPFLTSLSKKGQDLPLGNLCTELKNQSL